MDEKFILSTLPKSVEILHRWLFYKKRSNTISSKEGTAPFSTKSNAGDQIILGKEEQTMKKKACVDFTSVSWNSPSVTCLILSVMFLRELYLEAE